MDSVKDRTIKRFKKSVIALEKAVKLKKTAGVGKSGLGDTSF